MERICLGMVIPFLIWLSGCASQVAPTGGPADETPPEIVSTDPAQGSLNFLRPTITVNFSERVDRRSFEESVFLSPAAGRLSFDWGGEEVTIRLGDSLRGGTTYILTIGTDLRDTRNNAMDSAYTLAFSTGAVIDSGEVSGTIYDEKPGGVMVFSYLLGTAEGGADGDTLDPSRASPDFLTQSGTDGSFRIPHMKPGLYRIVAVRDVFKNLRYDVQTDAYGIPPEDLRVGGERRKVPGVVMRLAADDTLAPFLSGGRVTDNMHLTLRFNEPVDRRFLRREDVGITDTVTGVPLSVLDVSPVDSAWKEVVVTTVPQDSGVPYRVVLRNLADRKGNLAPDTMRTVVVTGTGLPDTVTPVLAWTVTTDSMKDIDPGGRLLLGFGEAVDTAAVTAALSVTDSSGKPVAGALAWEGASTAQFIPAAGFFPGAWYRISLVLDSLRDLAGNGFRDSVVVRNFRVTGEKELSSIEGTVVTDPAGGFAPRGPVHVQARKIGSGGGTPTRTTADSAGRFLLGNLREGSYVLWAFEDADSNGSYTAGLPYPARFSERFGAYADTLKLRPMWPLEGVVIRFNR